MERTRTNQFEGKSVVITGASSGFGHGTAIELAWRGACLVLAARSANTISELAQACETVGGRAIAVPTDVSNPHEVERLAQRALAECGQIDVWMNNAGVGVIGRFDVVPLQDHEQVIKTDLLGTMAGSYFALRHFRQRGEGTLINVASIIGKIPAPLYASYVAAKFGVVGFSDALRQELKSDKMEKIRVCTVLPMAHETEFFEHAANYTGHKAVPIPPTYDPKVTIDALVKLVAEPEDEVITGGQGGVFNILHHLMPTAVENMMAAKTENAQLRDAPSAPFSEGSLHRATEQVS